eukprot:4791046-Heterocapsa_arctica.AAC.1
MALASQRCLEPKWPQVLSQDSYKWLQALPKTALRSQRCLKPCYLHNKLFLPGIRLKGPGIQESVTVISLWALISWLRICPALQLSPPESVAHNNALSNRYPQGKALGIPWGHPPM